MKFCIFQRNYEVIKTRGKWRVFILGNDGKKRPARDIFIPTDVCEHDIKKYLEDMLHEYAPPDSLL